jgi:hypothetical protein
METCYNQQTLAAMATDDTPTSTSPESSFKKAIRLEVDMYHYAKTERYLKQLGDKILEDTQSLIERSSSWSPNPIGSREEYVAEILAKAAVLREGINGKIK